MKYFDVDKIEKEIEEIKEELIKVMVEDQSKYVRITGVSKQHISGMINGRQTFNLSRMFYVYRKIRDYRAKL